MPVYWTLLQAFLEGSWRVPGVCKDWLECLVLEEGCQYRDLGVLDMGLVKRVLQGQGRHREKYLEGA